MCINVTRIFKYTYIEEVRTDLTPFQLKFWFFLEMDNSIMFFRKESQYDRYILKHRRTSVSACSSAKTSRQWT